MYMRDMDINVHERLSSKTTQIKVKKQLVVRKDININVHERLSKTTQIKVKKQLVERKDIDLNVHERHGYKCI
jgi:hypothetical protein